MMNNKKGDSTSFAASWIASLVLSVVLFISVALLIYKCVWSENSNEAVESFDKIVELVNTAKEEGGLKSNPITMDSNTGLFFFNKGASGINVSSVYNSKILSNQELIAFIPKPGNSECKESCICFYRKMPIRDEKDKSLSNSKYTIKSPFIGTPTSCKPSKSDFFYNPGFFGSSFVYAIETDYRFSGGLFLERSDHARADSRENVLEERETKERNRQYTTYFKYYKGEMIICESHKCLEKAQQDIDNKQVSKK